MKDKYNKVYSKKRPTAAKVIGGVLASTLVLSTIGVSGYSIYKTINKNNLEPPPIVKPEEPEQKFIVTFVVEGITLPPQEVASISELQIPTSPKEGFKISGWLDPNGELFDFTKPLTENVTLTAVLEENKCTVTLLFNNTSTQHSITGTELIEEPEMPTYENLDYIGFFDTETNEQFDFTKSPTKDMTLKARYKQKTLLRSETGYENYMQKQAESVRLKIDYKLTDVNDKIYLPQDYYEYVGKENFRNIFCDYYTLNGVQKELRHNTFIEVKDLIPQDILDNKEYVDTLELELYLFKVYMADIQQVEVYTVTSDTRGVLAVDFTIGENSELRVSENLTPSATLVLIIDEYMSVMTGNFQKLLLTGDTLTIPAQDVEACAVEGFKGAFYMNFANQQPVDLTRDLVLNAEENKTGLALLKTYEPIKTFVNSEFQNLYNQNKNDYLRLKVKLNNSQEFFIPSTCSINGTLNGTLNFYGLQAMCNTTTNSINLTLSNLTEEDYYKIGMSLFADIELEIYLKMESGSMNLKSLSMFTILEFENGANSGIDTSNIVVSGA